MIRTVTARHIACPGTKIISSPLLKSERKNGIKNEKKHITFSCHIDFHRPHLKQQEFMETEHFKTLAKKRYMIEAKNAELKNSYGYDTANSTGISGMQLQGAITIFAANLRRIVSLSSNS